jgi:hypothetical protein
MFTVDNANATADEIGIAFERRGELSAVVEICRHFPLITGNADARHCVDNRIPETVTHEAAERPTAVHRIITVDKQLNSIGYALAVGLSLLSALSGCSVEDSHTAQRAHSALLGVKTIDLESCLGAPDNHSSFGHEDVLTYKGNSTSNSGINITLPVIGGGFNISGGGYCNATFRVVDGRVAAIHYNGETDALFAPDAYCAPIVRNCIDRPEARERVATPLR